jgi:hypothetical protein
VVGRRNRAPVGDKIRRELVQQTNQEAFGGIMTRTSLGIAAIAFMVSISVASASETTIPAAFHGVWQPAEPGMAPTCLPKDADMRQTISAERVDFHEGICWPKAISVTGAQSLRIDARCEQEDSSWESRQEWHVEDSNGRRRLSINNLDPARPYQVRMGLCSGEVSNGDTDSTSRSNVFPFPDGRYVTDKALCGLSEQEMLVRHGDMLGTMVRIINGTRLTNAYEMSCTVDNVRVDGDDVRFDAQCGREGQTSVVNGRYVRISPTSFRLGQKSFSLCGAEAPVQSGSTCYREGMSELEILPNADGTFEIGIESAQGNAHICSLAGRATKVTDGYLYAERLENGSQCELSIVLDSSGNVTFKDTDWTCKQYYCGARAAFENIEFGSGARVQCN